MKTIEWVMMAAFIGGLGLAFWKLYLFFPKTPLADDDTTPESVELLEKIMMESYREGINLSELYHAMQHHPEFDPKHFWRFNENRLHHLIEHYRFKDPSFRL
jgi:hypothetical protein